MKEHAFTIILILTFLAINAQQRGNGDCPAEYPSHPNWRERSVLVMTNLCRSDPTAFRDEYIGDYDILRPQNYPAVKPVYRDLDLNRVARTHSVDMAENCGMQHNSCDNTRWSDRIKEYYTDSYTLAENISTGETTPLGAVVQWVFDGDSIPAADNSDYDGHRANIMSSSYQEMGVGYAYGSNEWYHFWTQDFGGGQSEFGYHPIVAGTHLFLSNNKTDFIANYYDSTGSAPQTAQVIIEGESHVLTLLMGGVDNGAYAVSVAEADSCRNYYFQFVDANGTDWRYPAYGVLCTYREGGCDRNYTPPESLSQGIIQIGGPVRSVPDVRIAAFPNRIEFQVRNVWEGLFKIEVYDVQGRRVWKRQGHQSGKITWGIHGDKNRLSNGIYFAVLRSEKNIIRKRFTFIF